MARQNLTDRTLKALQPAPKGQRYEIFDAVVPSMGIRVTDKMDRDTKAARRSFFLLARYPDPTKTGTPNPTRRTLGEYPAIELADARKKAREWLALLEKGIDPRRQIEMDRLAREKAEAEKQDRSFEAVLARFINVRRRDGVRKADEDERDFRRDCLPAWKSLAVDDIAMTDILKVVEAIRDRGATRQALNMAQKIGTFFNWCVDDDLIPVSPYRPKRVGIALGERQSRDRVLTDDDIRAFWTATGELAPTHRDVYRTLLLTGQRLNDIARASWSEVDMDKKTLTVPAERFKSDRDHVVPLTDDVISILGSLPRWKGCPWVFSLDGKRAATIGDNVKRRLDHKMGTVEPWVTHDLRRTVRTRLSELDVMDEVAEAVIGHVPSKLNRTYNHSDRLRVKMEALTRWQGALRGIVGAPTADNVVRLDARAS